MEKPGYSFLDRSGAAAPKHRPKEPVVIPHEAIDAEVERLMRLPRPANGRRVSLIANPDSGDGDCLAPSIAVSLCVLLPGERTQKIRHNSSQVNFCIRGCGTAIVDGKRIDYEQYDCWNTPPWAAYEHVNETDEPHVRLTYSNAPLLEKINVHVVEEDPAVDAPARAETESGGEDAARRTSPFGTFPISDDGATLMPYEKLISPDVVEMRAL